MNIHTVHEQSSKPAASALRMRRRVTREKMEKRARLVFALISAGALYELSVDNGNHPSGHVRMRKARMTKTRARARRAARKAGLTHALQSHPPPKFHHLSTKVLAIQTKGFWGMLNVRGMDERFFAHWFFCVAPNCLVNSFLGTWYFFGLELGHLQVKMVMAKKNLWRWCPCLVSGSKSPVKQLLCGFVWVWTSRKGLDGHFNARPAVVNGSQACRSQAKSGNIHRLISE